MPERRGESAMIFADKITALRKKNGWSQEELAEKMSVSRQAVSKWEGAQSVPDLEKILLLSRLFGVSTDYLLKDEEGEPEYLGAQEEPPAVRRVSMEEANAFLHVKEDTAGKIAFATLLCILSPVALFLLAAASETGALAVSEGFACGMGLILMFIFVAAAVAIYIFCGSKTSAFEYLEKEAFETEYGVAGMVKQRQSEYKDTYTRANISGACLCILSVIPIFAGALISHEDLFMVAMLSLTMLLAGIGVVFFITAGIRWASMQKLLQEGDYTQQKKAAASLSGAVSTAYWLFVVAGFLGYSFCTKNWQNSWIIWPVTGVVYAAVMVICGALRRKR